MASRMAGVMEEARWIGRMTPGKVAELMEEGDNSEYVFSVHNRGVESIGGLEKYKKLRSLDLSFNKIKVVEGLSQAIELRELKIYGNELESLCNLEHNRALEVVHADRNSIDTAPNVSHLKKLSTLHLQHNRISSLKGLGHCVSLTELDVSDNRVSKVSGMRSLRVLECLKLNGNRLSDLGDIPACMNLVELQLSRNGLSAKSLRPLSGLKKLETIRLEDNGIRSLSDLPELAALTELYLAHNAITTLSGCAKFSKLELLDVSDNRVSDVMELNHLLPVTELHDLMLSGNPVCEHAEFASRLARCVREDTISTARPTSARPLSARPRTPRGRPGSAGSARGSPRGGGAGAGDTRSRPLMRPASAKRGDSKLKKLEEMDDVDAMARSLRDMFSSVKKTLENPLETSAPAPRPPSAGMSRKDSRRSIRKVPSASGLQRKGSEKSIGAATAADKPPTIPKMANSRPGSAKSRRSSAGSSTVARADSTSSLGSIQAGEGAESPEPVQRPSKRGALGAALSFSRQQAELLRGSMGGTDSSRDDGKTSDDTGNGGKAQEARTPMVEPTVGGDDEEGSGESKSMSDSTSARAPAVGGLDLDVLSARNSKGAPEQTPRSAATLESPRYSTDRRTERKRAPVRKAAPARGGSYARPKFKIPAKARSRLAENDPSAAAT